MGGPFCFRKTLVFHLQFAAKPVILSGAPDSFIAGHSACGAESKDLGGPYLTQRVDKLLLLVLLSGHNRSVIPTGA
jgi:hypothetical protein